MRLLRYENLLWLLLFVWSGACQTKPAAPEETGYFPVADFIRNQVHYVDSLGFPLLKFTTLPQGRTDSANISQEEFAALAQNFMTPDLNDPLLHKQYTENSFADQTIGSATLTYATTNAELPLQRLDVIIHPDPVLDDQVRSIYMEKNYRTGDTAVLEKLYWKADRNFQLITTRRPGHQKPETTITKVVWKADPQQN